LLQPPTSIEASVLTPEEAVGLIADDIAQQELLDAFSSPASTASRPGGLTFGTALLSADGRAIGENPPTVTDEALLLVADLGLEPFAGHVICVADQGQIACGPTAEVVALDIPSRMVAKATIAPSTPAEAVNVLVIPGNEEDRPLVLAGTRLLHTNDVSSEAQWSPPIRTERVMDPDAFGCGTVWLVDSLTEHDDYPRLRDRDPSAPLWVVYEACPDAADALAQLVLIVDGASAEVLGSGLFTTPTRTIAVDIQDLVPAGARVLQAGYLPVGSDASPSFSMAVTLR
jgi:hypothetical protein